MTPPSIMDKSIFMQKAQQSRLMSSPSQLFFRPLHERLNNITITTNSRLVSFDVTSLFTKVPVDDLLDYLAGVLDNYELSLHTSNIIKLISLCIKNCKFSFNGNFYEQVFSMSMGNPLSPLLSNIYMEFF